MAYRFDGTDDYIQFSSAPFNGYTAGAITFAVFVNMANALGRDLIWFTTSSGGRILAFETNTSNPRLTTAAGANTADVTQTIATSAWRLLAVTYPGSGGTARFHQHNGTSWAHANATSGSAADSSAIGGTDLIRVGTRNLSQFLGADMVCCGVKKANSSDAAIETLSPTHFQFWRDFAFDWLIGFDSSLETAGVLQDQASPGTGDETAITGTSAVSDPGTWNWTGYPAIAPTANFTGTPLTGGTPLSVAFTDTSTDTPTSWAWTFGDGGTSTSQNPTHSYLFGGVYTVTLVATNASGSDTETKTAYVSVAETIVYAAGGGIEIH